MLQAHRPDNLVNPDTPPTDFRSMVESLAQAVAFIRRHLWIVLVAWFVSIGAALLYLIAAAPTFTARAELVIDSKGAPGDPASVSTIVGSHIAMIKSETVARAVIEKLDLAEDPEFAGQAGRSKIRSLSALLGWSRPETESTPMQYAVESFERKLSAKRTGVTYIVEITFESSNPERAAQLVNAVAEAHIMSAMDAKYKSNLRSEKWVKDRMDELRGRAAAAQKAVADYRKNRNDGAVSADTVDTGNPSSQLTGAKAPGDLRELEAAADSAAKAPDNFLRMLRYMDATQQQSLPVFEARVLTEASRPLRPNWPKARIVLGISMVGGMLLGIFIGVLRDVSDRVMRAIRQVWRDPSEQSPEQRRTPHLDEGRRERSRAI